ncbi:MAG: phytoene/squalene synthase family protein [Verrucomicrobiota bacterium]
MALAPQVLLTDLLRDVSRSFYLTLSVLPRSVRSQVGLAYLLARTTDTIADTAVLPLELRLRELRRFGDRIAGGAGEPLDFKDLAGRQGSGAERTLLDNAEAAVGLLATFSAADQALIREVLRIIVSGQELDLTRFHNASAGRVTALQSAAELDDYTYRVAGCVGEFWTRICRAHVYPRARLDDDRMLALGVRFGKGLQLVNILRDLPADLANGRCYLPADALQDAGLQPPDLLDPTAWTRLRPVYQTWLNTAADHLAAGWDYTTSLPWSAVRVRLACAWPLLIGRDTVLELGRANVLTPGQRVKISRSRVRNILLKSALFYPFPGAWRALYPALPQPV